MEMRILMRLKFKLISVFSCISMIMSPTVGAFGAEEVIKINEIMNFLTKNQALSSEEFKGTSELDILYKMINFFIHKMPYDCEHIKDVQTIYDIILKCKSRLEKWEFTNDDLHKKLEEQKIIDDLHKKLVEQEKIYAATLNDFKILQINKFLNGGTKPVSSEFSGNSEVEILHKMYLFLNGIKNSYVISHYDIASMRTILYKMNVRLERFKNRKFDLQELEKWLLKKEEELKLSEIEKFLLNKNFSLLRDFSSDSEKKSIYKMCLFLRNTELKNYGDKEYIKYLYEVSVKVKNYLTETNRLDNFLSWNLKALELIYNSRVNDLGTGDSFNKSIYYWKEASKMYHSIKEMLIINPLETEPYDASFEDILYLEKYCLSNALLKKGILHYCSEENLEALQLLCQSYCLSRDEAKNKEPFDRKYKKWKCIPKCVEKVSLDIKKLRLSGKDEEAFEMTIEFVKQLIIINYDSALIDSCRDVILLNIREMFSKGEQLERKNLYKEARRAYFFALEGATFINCDDYRHLCNQRINICMERLKGTIDPEILELND